MTKLYDLSGKRVWVAGHRGMVGSAIVRRLADMGCEVLTVGRDIADLRRQAEIEAWLAEHAAHVHEGNFEFGQTFEGKTCVATQARAASFSVSSRACNSWAFITSLSPPPISSKGAVIFLPIHFLLF